MAFRLVASLIVAVGVLFMAPQAQAFDQTKNRIGVGIELGSPSGLTGKLYLDESNALQAGIGLYGWFGSGVSLHLDYVHEFRDAFSTHNSDFKLFPYAGAGLEGGAWRGVCFWYRWYNDGYCGTHGYGGVRVIGGIAAQFTRDPIELALELAPNFNIDSYYGFRFEFDAALVFRYYFPM